MTLNPMSQDRTNPGRRRHQQPQVATTYSLEDEVLLAEGRYREFFYKGLSKPAQTFLRTPATEGTHATWRCQDCKQDKPRVEFSKDLIANPDRRRCNECVLSGNNASHGRWLNTEGILWRKQAACADLPTDWFFPEGRDAARKSPAVALCAGCPVRAACASMVAQSTGSRAHGIFAGKYYDGHGRATDLID